MNLFEYLNARAERGANVDLLIARTQRNLSNRTLAVIAVIIVLLFFLPKPIDPLVKDILLIMIGGLASNWATQNGFWYGRPRAAGIPDPPTVTNTRTVIEQQSGPNPPTLPVAQSQAAPVLPSGPKPPDAPAGG